VSRRPVIKLGGIQTAAKIVAQMNLAGADTVLHQLYQLDEDIAEQISDQILPFDKLAIADARSLQILVREIDSSVLIIALKGLSKKIRDPFLQSMSSRARAIFIDEMEELGPIRLSDVEAARTAVVRFARLLADEGRFALPQEGYIY
tara:strand:+ start:266 stop:706 length:441 start_codon:yes stop_codon:yes gene_type:complete